jgi:hypothetical protein
MRLRALAVAAVFAIAAPAFAQTDQQTDQPAPEQGQQQGAHPGVSPEARAAMRKACAADIQSYCSDSENGGRRLGQCLRQNFDKLSGDCQTQLKAMRSNWRRQDQQPQQPQ